MAVIPAMGAVLEKQILLILVWGTLGARAENSAPGIGQANAWQRGHLSGRNDVTTIEECIQAISRALLVTPTEQVSKERFPVPGVSHLIESGGRRHAVTTLSQQTGEVPTVVRRRKRPIGIGALNGSEEHSPQSRLCAQ